MERRNPTPDGRQFHAIRRLRRKRQPEPGDATLANNATTPGPGTPDQVNARRPYPYQGTLFFDTSQGSSSYNALQLRAERRFSQGFQFLIGYTWSKSIDNGTSGWFGAENGVGASSSALQDPAHPEASRS